MEKRKVFVIALGIVFVVLVIFVGKAVASSTQGDNIFGTTTYLAKGDDSDRGSNGSSGSGSSGSSSSDDDKKSEDKREEKKEEGKKEEVRVESKDGQTRVEIRERSDKNGTRFRQEIRTPTGEIKFEFEDGKAKVKVETERGKEEFKVASPSSQASELANIESSKEEKSEVKIKIRDNRFELKAKGATALTNFPLTLNPETNELSVTTPKGTILIKTLPPQAVKNILASNVMDRVLGQSVSEDEEDKEDEEIEDNDHEELGTEETEVKAEGLVESITDTQIVVSGLTFSINKSTKFEGSVSVGSGVKIKGVPQNGALTAKKVELESKVNPRVKIEGVVESVNGNSVVVGGITFNISDTTKVEGILRPGQIVELKSQISTNGVLQANKIEVKAPGEGLILAEEKGQAVFKVKGQKDFRFFNIFPVTLPVEATVSVETGKVLSVSRSFFLNIFGFLFSS